MSDFRQICLATLAVRASMAAVAALAVACSSSSSGTSLVTSCQLPSDQTKTISGHWLTRPVPVAFAQGQFSNSEVASITAAADTWNNFYMATEKFKLIDYTDSSGNVRTSSIPKPSNICGQTILQNGVFSSPVVIYKDGTWPSSSPMVIALTSFCPTQATPLNSFYMAIMELNYQDFFVNGNPVPDLQSILLHEFGHLAGLDHSCEPSTSKAGMPDCNNSGTDPSYSAAVMASIFFFDPSTHIGQAKRTLNSNDQGRANCLYP